MGRKLHKQREDLKEEIFLAGLICLGVVCYWLVKKYWNEQKQRSYSTTENVEIQKHKTIIKYTFNADEIKKVREASGLGLNNAMFVFDDYPGLCCNLCGPIFHVNVESKGSCLYYRCTLCERELPSDESKQIQKLTDQLLSTRRLGNLSVLCPNNKYGCKSVFQLKRLKEHIPFCSYVKIPCPQECGLSISKLNIKQHLATCQVPEYTQMETIPSCPPPPYPIN